MTVGRQALHKSQMKNNRYSGLRVLWGIFVKCLALFSAVPNRFSGSVGYRRQMCTLLLFLTYAYLIQPKPTVLVLKDLEENRRMATLNHVVPQDSSLAALDARRAKVCLPKATNRAPPRRRCPSKVASRHGESIAKQVVYLLCLSLEVACLNLHSSWATCQ